MNGLVSFDRLRTNGLVGLRTNGLLKLGAYPVLDTGMGVKSQMKARQARQSFDRLRTNGLVGLRTNGLLKLGVCPVLDTGMGVEPQNASVNTSSTYPSPLMELTRVGKSMNRSP